MTNEEFDKAVWRKGDSVKVNEVAMEVTIIYFEERFILTQCGRILECDEFEQIEKHTPIEQLPEKVVNKLTDESAAGCLMTGHEHEDGTFNRSMWDNDCPNPAESELCKHHFTCPYVATVDKREDVIGLNPISTGRNVTSWRRVPCLKNRSCFIP